MTGSRPPSAEARVLLVDPYVAREDPMERKFVELYPSLGILTLAAYLRQEGHDVAVVDLTFSRDLRPYTTRLRRFAPQVVGVHTKTLTFPRAIRIARLAKGAGALAVAGGPDAATRPAEYLAAGFDAVATGEGEAALAELAACVAADEGTTGLAGFITQQGDRLVAGPKRPLLKDLDRLPLPAWDLVDMERYLAVWEERTGERRAAVLTSRGCPFDCSWCSKPTFGRSFRQQTPARVLAELRALQEQYRVDYVRFCDDVFGVQRTWIDSLLDGMIGQGRSLKFECLARVDLLKPELLAKMRAAGLARVYVGVESGSQKMLDLMNRGTTLAQIERTAGSLRAAGVRQFWFLMLGYPGETLEDIEATLALFRRFSPEEYSVSIAVPIPGTRFYDTVRDRLSGRAKPTARSGGHTLLYDAAYPQALYRWEQARFDWEAALQRVRGKLTPRVLERLMRAADRFHHEVATPLLLGERHPRPSRPSARAVESGRGPAVHDPARAVR